MDHVSRIRQQNVGDVHRLIVAVEKAKSPGGNVDEGKCWQAAKNWEEKRFMRYNALTPEYHSTIRQKLNLLKERLREEMTKVSNHGQVQGHGEMHSRNHVNGSISRGPDGIDRPVRMNSPFEAANMHQSGIPPRREHTATSYGDYNRPPQGPRETSRSPPHQDPRYNTEYGAFRQERASPQQVQSRHDMYSQGSHDPPARAIGERPQSQHSVHNGIGQALPTHSVNAERPRDPRYGETHYLPSSNNRQRLPRDGQVPPQRTPHQTNGLPSARPGMNDHYIQHSNSHGGSSDTMFNRQITSPAAAALVHGRSQPVAPVDHRTIDHRRTGPPLRREGGIKNQYMDDQANNQFMESKIRDKYYHVKTQMKANTIERIYFLRRFFTQRLNKAGTDRDARNRCMEYLNFFTKCEGFISDDNPPKDGYRNGLARLQTMYQKIRNTEARVKEKLAADAKQLASRATAPPMNRPGDHYHANPAKNMIIPTRNQNAAGNVNHGANSPYPPRSHEVKPLHSRTHPHHALSQHHQQHNRGSGNQAISHPGAQQGIGPQYQHLPNQQIQRTIVQQEIPKQYSRRISQQSTTPAMARQKMIDQQNSESTVGKRTLQSSQVPDHISREVKKAKHEVTPPQQSQPKQITQHPQSQIPQTNVQPKVPINVNGSFSNAKASPHQTFASTYSTPQEVKPEVGRSKSPKIESAPQSNQVTPPITEQASKVEAEAVKEEEKLEPTLSEILNKESDLAIFLKERQKQKPEERKELDWANAAEIAKPVVADFNSLFT